MSLLYLPKFKAPSLLLLDLQILEIEESDEQIFLNDCLEKRFVERCKVDTRMNSLNKINEFSQNLNLKDSYCEGLDGISILVTPVSMSATRPSTCVK